MQEEIATTKEEIGWLRARIARAESHIAGNMGRILELQRQIQELQKSHVGLIDSEEKKGAGDVGMG